MQLAEVLRVHGHDGDRRPLSAVLLVHELQHHVVVAVRGRGRVGPSCSENLLAVAVEDPELQAARLGEPRQRRHVATAIR